MVASGIVGIISWRRPLTLVVCIFPSDKKSFQVSKLEANPDGEMYMFEFLIVLSTLSTFHLSWFESYGSECILDLGNSRCLGIKMGTFFISFNTLY